MKEARSQPISKTYEGIVLQLIDHSKNQVVELQKVKSIEYLMFSSMHSILMSAIERGEIDTHFDKTIMTYGREHRAIAKDQLPHPESFYSEVFNQAIALLSQRKNSSNYLELRSMLFDDRVKFFTEVISAHAEKRYGKQYTGVVDFSNQHVFERREPTVESIQIEKPKPKAK